MEQGIESVLGEDIRRLDEMYYQLADVLDVKASIILVVDTFLATLSGQVLVVKDLPPAMKGIEIAAVVVLSAVLILAVVSLWPRNFGTLPKPEEWSAHYETLLNHFKTETNATVLATQQFEQDRKKRTLDRIAQNAEVTAKKSKLNKWAFYGTAVVITLNGCALLWLATWHL